MPGYLQRFDATPEARRWPLVRGWIFGEPLRQALRPEGLAVGQIDQKGGPVPEAWPWRWG